MLLNGPSCASNLVPRHLQVRGFKLLGRDLALELPLVCLAKIGVGLAHAEGEQILAFGANAPDEALGMFVVVTDRRIAGICGNAPPFDVRYGDMHQIESKSGVLNIVLKVLTSRGWQDCATDKHKPVSELLQALLTVHPQQREPAPNPLCTPTPSDPAGAHAALQRVDPHSLSALLIRSVGSRVQRGEMPAETGADFVARSVLLFRNEFAGRGMSGSGWMSPLGVPDLLFALSHVLGPPSGTRQHPSLAAQFQVGSGGGSNAALSTALGLASAAVLGVGWIATAKRQLNVVTVHFQEGKGFCGFLLTEPNNRPAGRIAPRLVGTVLRALQSHEASLLAKRCLRGWDPSAEQLAANDDQAVHAELGAMIG